MNGNRNIKYLNSKDDGFELLQPILKMLFLLHPQDWGYTQCESVSVDPSIHKIDNFQLGTVQCTNLCNS